MIARYRAVWLLAAALAGLGTVAPAAAQSDAAAAPPAAPGARARQAEPAAPVDLEELARRPRPGQVRPGDPKPGGTGRAETGPAARPAAEAEAAKTGGPTAGPRRADAASLARWRAVMIRVRGHAGTAQWRAVASNDPWVDFAGEPPERAPLAAVLTVTELKTGARSAVDLVVGEGQGADVRVERLSRVKIGERAGRPALYLHRGRVVVVGSQQEPIAVTTPETTVVVRGRVEVAHDETTGTRTRAAEAGKPPSNAGDTRDP